MALVVASYLIWKVRNEVIFQNRSSDGDKVVRDVISFMNSYGSSVAEFLIGVQFYFSSFHYC